MNIESLEEDEFLKGRKRKRRSSRNKSTKKSRRVANRAQRKAQRSNRRLTRRIKKDDRRVQRGKKPRFSTSATAINPVGSRVIKKSVTRRAGNIISKRPVVKPSQIAKATSVRRASKNSNLQTLIQPIPAKSINIRPVQTTDRSRYRITKTPDRKLVAIRPAVIKKDIIGSSPVQSVRSTTKKPPVKKIVKPASKSVQRDPVRRDPVKRDPVKRDTVKSAVIENQNVSKQRLATAPLKDLPMEQKQTTVASNENASNVPAGEKESKTGKYLVYGGLAVVGLLLGFMLIRQVNEPVKIITETIS